jgi:glycosyltransferase involved in cell wall biosynthesis
VIDKAIIAVVVPAHDEARWIVEVISAMPAFVDVVVVVDDASTDATATLTRETTSSCRVELVRHRHNRGVGAAIASGYRRALELGAEVIAVMAGDGQMDPADLRGLVDPVRLGQADYAKGNRLAHPEVWRRMPRARLLGSLVLSRLTSLATGTRIRDSQCGYTAVSRRALERLDLEALWPRYGYPNDLLGALALAGQRIVERPVRPVYRGERSGMRVWHVAVIGGLIARTGWRRVMREVLHNGPMSDMMGSGRR